MMFSHGGGDLSIMIEDLHSTAVIKRENKNITTNVHVQFDTITIIILFLSVAEMTKFPTISKAHFTQVFRVSHVEILVRSYI